MAQQFRSGFVSVIGRPNVGKSTLINCFIGEKINIVSNKPQTTRRKIQSILTRDDFQIVFIDTPGMHTPKSKLGTYMQTSAEKSLNDTDVVLYMVEPFEKINAKDSAILEKLSRVKDCAVILVINKLDTVEKPQLLKVMDSYQARYPFKAIVPIAAKTGDNVSNLLDTVKAFLPIGPQYFPEHMITDEPERQLVAEMVREKALMLLQEELPHGLFTEVAAMKKRENQELFDIDVNIYCEKASHKGMIIGKQGAMLKDIGKRARQDMERFLGAPVYLQLWVKVKPGWRDSDMQLRNFGYDSRRI